MNETVTISIRTLTPIWTGDVNGRCSEIKETGIIGSMRWWYEAIVRGLGGYACDPTGDSKCELSGKEKTDEERRRKLCPVCYLFGCTGWKRGFSLEVVNSGENAPFQLVTLDKKDKFNNWWLSQIFEKILGTNLPFGEVTLDIKPTRGLSCDAAIKQMKALLSLMSHCGAIGAKNQYGFGQFDWDEKMEIKDAITIIQKFLNEATFKDGSNKNVLYSLHEFWLYDIKIPKDNKLLKKFLKANLIGKGTYPIDYLPVSFDIRYKLPDSDNRTGLRQAYYEKHKNKHKTRLIFGTLKDDRIGSRVFVSHLFKKDKADSDYWLRVWGFTEEDVGKEVGEELNNMFMLEKLTPVLGKEIIKLVQGGQ